MHVRPPRLQQTVSDLNKDFVEAPATPVGRYQFDHRDNPQIAPNRSPAIRNDAWDWWGIRVRVGMTSGAAQMRRSWRGEINSNQSHPRTNESICRLFCARAARCPRSDRSIALSSAASAAAADALYPIRPVRLIVAYAPGGAVEPSERIMAQDLALVLDSRSSSTTARGWRHYRNGHCGARCADGYTLLVGSVGVASMPGLYRKLPFDPLTDFAPISVSITGLPAGRESSVAASSVKDASGLRSRAPANSTLALRCWLHHPSRRRNVKEHARIDIVHVPYKSAGSHDVSSREYPEMCAPVVVMQPMANAGKVRAARR